MNRIFFPSQYLNYFFKAKGLHGIHSAFVYELFEKVITDFEYYDFAPIEFLRRKLLHSHKTIEVIDFGAGGPGKKMKKVKDIARVSSISSGKGRLLFRLVNFMQPKIMVEMGTSLGISTLYQHKACPDASFITMEGSPQTASIASENFNLLKAEGIKQVTGDFKDTLPKLLAGLSTVDYVFFDGNHRKEATLDYFRSFKEKASANTVFVFDDIRWSQGMYEAWNEVIKEPTATVTVDLFSMGLVFFRPGQVKEHFVLKFKRFTGVAYIRILFDALWKR
ncbi:MAG TPA: class I SAM-dependent methyltransferase [Bacteroidia bacterium]|nr:class I SAM-dependent methyltransferase [Bacteroidia bacterium]